MAASTEQTLRPNQLSKVLKNSEFGAFTANYKVRKYININNIICMYICICICIDIYKCICIYVYMYMDNYVYMYMYMYCESVFLVGTLCVPIVVDSIDGDGVRSAWLRLFSLLLDCSCLGPTGQSRIDGS